MYAMPSQLHRDIARNVRDFVISYLPSYTATVQAHPDDEGKKAAIAKIQDELKAHYDDSNGDAQPGAQTGVKAELGEPAASIACMIDALQEKIAQSRLQGGAPVAHMVFYEAMKEMTAAEESGLFPDGRISLVDAFDFCSDLSHAAGRYPKQFAAPLSPGGRAAFDR